MQPLDRRDKVVLDGCEADIVLLLPTLLRSVASGEVASNLGPALASILIYLLMAAVLFWKPTGLFPARG